ncbi:type VI secretion protein [Novosphingobium sp. FSY-8]|uniref:Type VI secretion protein n=2 Tax=Novosphingobium ovatum TaxID=1908523 RepID=A0ABW9XAR6_9SPHN|nr:type VI secretion protein [Novosphingobium ovatum]
MDEPLRRDRLFVALTRPQMFGGVTYGFFVLNLILCAEAFLLLRTVWVVGLALGAHGAAWLACRREPRLIDLWVIRARHCRAVPNHRFWRCNSYRA